MNLSVEAKTFAVDNHLSDYGVSSEETFDLIMASEELPDDIVVWEPFEDYNFETLKRFIEQTAESVQGVLDRKDSEPSAEGKATYAVLVREIGEDSFFDHKPVRPNSEEHIRAQKQPELDYVELYTQAAPQSTLPQTDEDLRNLWKANGGSFHGPVVETGVMPEEDLLKFLRNLTQAVPLLTLASIKHPAALQECYNSESTPHDRPEDH